MKTAHVHDWSEAQITAIRTCLKNILASKVFEHAPRQQRFLTYLVEHAIAGDAESLKGYTIGIEVFDRGHEFDPNVEAIVRVEATRLRNKLRDYYDHAGVDDPVALELPKGGYALHISFRAIPGANMPQPANSLPPPGKPALAVLPFLNIGTLAQYEHLSDGIASSLISELSNLPGPPVLSRMSSFAYKNTAKTTMEIGKELGASYLLEGSLQAAKDRVRLNVQLVDARTGANIWAEQFDAAITDIFATEDDLSQRILAALRPRLATLVEPMSVPSTPHVFLQQDKEPEWQRVQAAIEEARRLFLKAAAQDSSYAAAHALLARTLIIQWCMGWGDPNAALERALQHAHTALALGGHLPYAHGAQIWVHQGNKACEEAIAGCRDAIAHNTGQAEAYLLLSLNLSAAELGKEALHHAEKARLMLPQESYGYHYAIGQCHFALKNLEQAQASLKRCSVLCNVELPEYLYRATGYGLMGDRDQEALAKRELQTALLGNSNSMMFRFFSERRNNPAKPRTSTDRRRQRSSH